MTRALAFRFRASGATVEIDVYDYVGDDMDGGASARSVREALKAAPGVTEIAVRINSSGGDAIEGIAIHDMLAAHPAQVKVRIEGIAASAASLIAMAGNEIVMAENAFMMIHNVTSLAIGDGDDLRDAADVTDKIRDTYANIYAKRSGQPLKSVVNAMDAETWMTAEEALALGYATAIDKIEPVQQVAAAWHLKDFARVPPAVRVMASAAHRPHPLADEGRSNGDRGMKTILAFLGLTEGATEADAVRVMHDTKTRFEAVAAFSGSIDKLTGKSGADSLKQVLEWKDAAGKVVEMEAAAKTAEVTSKVDAKVAEFKMKPAQRAFALKMGATLANEDFDLYLDQFDEEVVDKDPEGTNPPRVLDRKARIPTPSAAELKKLGVTAEQFQETAARQAERGLL